MEPKHNTKLVPLAKTCVRIRQKKNGICGMTFYGDTLCGLSDRKSLDSILLISIAPRPIW